LAFRSAPACLTAALLATVGAFGCASPHRTAPVKDAGGVTDAAAPDAGSTDAGAADTGTKDSGTEDTSTKDGGTKDTGAEDTTADVAVDAGKEATACFVGGPPGPGDKILEVAKPNIACPTFDEPFIGSPGDKLGKATLKVEIGAADPKTGAFVPYKDGEFVPIRPGAQPGFHVWAAFRVHLPGTTASKGQLEAQARGLVDCKIIGLGALPNYYAAKDAQVAGAYSYQSKLTPGMTVIFQQTETWMSPQWCGKWLDLRVQVRDVANQKWGKAQVLVRIWDGVAKK